MSTATTIERDTEERDTESEGRPLFEAGYELVDGVWLERNMGARVSHISAKLRGKMSVHSEQHVPGFLVGRESPADSGPE